jgi:hypothetical protein
MINFVNFVMPWCRKSSRRSNLSCSAAGQDVTPVEKEVEDVDLNNNKQQHDPIEASTGDPVLKFVKATNSIENEVGPHVHAHAR